MGTSLDQRKDAGLARRRRRRTTAPNTYSGTIFRLRPRVELMEDRTLLSTFLVNNTGDGGPGSLRQAILDSNAATGTTNTIDFDIPGQGVQTIEPLSPLPAITNPVLIDGESQPGYAGKPLTELNGGQAGGGDGLLIIGPDVTVRGLNIDGFSQGAGIHITGTAATGDWVCGSFLGTDPTGTQSEPNNVGVEIDAGATHDLIGANGDGVNDAGERNLLSGNLFTGVWITGQGTDGNAVAGNFMGTDISGTIALDNATQPPSDSRGNVFGGGVAVSGGASDNRIGTDGASVDDVGERNVIGGSDNDAIDMWGTGTDGNVVAGNYIGTDVTGTRSLGIAGDGVFLAEGASSNWIGVNSIGGTAFGDEGNLISGNGYDGVQIVSGPGSNGNVVAGNTIGTDVTGTLALGNGGQGVEVDAGCVDNTIGGTGLDSGNLISANEASGIWLNGDGVMGNVVQRNKIGTDVTGTVALGNAFWGVVLQEAAENTVGGPAAGAGNLVSGNNQGGVGIRGIDAVGDIVQGNRIGTDISGMKALGNAYSGVYVGDWGVAGDAASDATIGGTADGAGNVISASAHQNSGVWITGAGTTGVVVQGNRIGTDVSGTVAMGNAYDGVKIDVGATHNTIGGTAAGAGNVISGNSQDGIEVSGAANLIVENQIGTNSAGTADLANVQGGVVLDNGATNNTIGGLVTSDGVFDGFTFATEASSPELTLPSNPSGPAGQEIASGTNVVYHLDLEMAGDLMAIVQPHGLMTQLALFDSRGHMLIQSDGLSSSDPVDAIDQYLQAGTYSLTVGSTSTGGQGTFTFTTMLTPAAAPFRPIPVAGYSVAIVAGDFNGDGRLDLAVAGSVLGAQFSVSGTVSILMGNGDGTFQPPIDYPIEGIPSAIVAGDFNGDGRLDLAVSDWAGIQILLENGNGTFQPASTIATGIGGSLVAGDFNGDGRLDIVSPGYEADTVSILLGNGDGTFDPAVDYTVGTSPSAIVAGDFNGDGRLDLAVADAGDEQFGFGTDPGGVSVLLGNGDGTFEPAIQYAAGTGAGSIVAGDFNNDGHLDLAVADYDANLGTAVSVLMGNGDGTFQSAEQYTVGIGPHSLVAGDFNGDGRIDLAVANILSNNVSILLGNGDGTFQTAQQYGVVGQGENGPGSIVAGDFNGDGRGDLAVCELSAPGDGFGVSVLLGNGNGTFQAQAGAAVSEPDAIVAGDFNGDGRLDLAVASASNQVYILLGNGDGTFEPAAQFAVGGTAISLVAGDFNGDGRTDLAVTCGSYFSGIGSVSVLLGNGDGTFRPAVQYAVGSDPNAIVAGNFGGDGHLDLATANLVDDTISVLLGKGDGTFQPQATYAVGPSPQSLVAGNFRGESRSDLVVADAGGVQLLLSNGDGTFQPAETLDGGSDGPLVAGDFNVDGHLDLANASGVFLGNGDGTFRPLIPFTGANGYGLAGDGDFNGDGKLDLVFESNGNQSGSVSVLLGNGDGTFQPASSYSYSVGGSPFFLVAGDFNEDGRSDLVDVTSYSNNISVLLSNGNGTFVDPGQLATTRDSTPLVADGTGDGTGDVLIVDGSGNILYRQGIPGQPGSVRAARHRQPRIPLARYRLGPEHDERPAAGQRRCPRMMPSRSTPGATAALSGSVR